MFYILQHIAFIVNIKLIHHRKSIYARQKPQAPPEPVSFFEKKETKKLYNGKLRFPKGINLANTCQIPSAKRSFAQKFFASFFQERSRSGQSPGSLTIK